MNAILIRSLEAQNCALRQQNETLLVENEGLRARLAVHTEENLLPLPEGLHLTPNEEAILRLLLKRDVVTRDHIMTELYSTRADDPPDEHICSVWMCRLKARLRAAGIDWITIENRIERGWRIRDRGAVLARLHP